MFDFTYSGLPSRVVFGEGTIASLPSELARLGIKRPLLLSTPQQRTDVERLARDLVVPVAGIFSNATMHTPVDVTERALEVAWETKADGIVALGGGSTIGLGKAIALRVGLPQVVLPTTYAGSEMTPILGETSNGLKKTIRDNAVLPQTVIYDVNLSVDLPQSISNVSGLNAIAHAVEALYAQDRNPIISLMAEEGIRALAGALPRIRVDAKDRSARSDALYGAWLCGMCLGSVGMSLHHKLCHTLGGSFDLPHAETHAIVLPHAVAYNTPAAPEAMARIARALGTEDAATGLFDLAVSIGAPTQLSSIGLPKEGINKATAIALENPYWNPRPIEGEAIRALITDAWEGKRPMAGSAVKREQA